MADRTVTKKVRLEKREATLLGRLAREKKVTESDVLREGLAKVALSCDRDEFVRRMKELFPGPEPPKERFELR
jgi:hypothetical protein